MKTKLVALSACLAAGMAFGVPTVEEFSNPKREHRPETWFHMIGGNVSKEGLTADLEAIAAAGYQGIQLFHGYFKESKDSQWPGMTNQIKCLSREWDDLVLHAAKECERLGLTLKLQNCPGWSMSGGPWIRSSKAMRELFYTRADVVSDGVSPVAATCDWTKNAPEPWRDFHDVATLAFPTPDGDLAEPHKPAKEELKGHARFISFDRPVTVRTVSLPSPREVDHDHSYYPDFRAVVSVRGTDGGWKTIAERKYPVGCWQDHVPFSISVPKTTAAEWKVEIVTPYAVCEFPYARLSSSARLDNWEAHAGWVLRGLAHGDNAGQGEAEWIDPKKIVIVSEGERSTNALVTAKLPKGRWTILRFGHVNMGFRNHPAPPEATGWECDKLDPRGIEANFAGYVGRLVDGPLKGRVKGVLIDSWECQRQSWTWKMPEYFDKACDYDLTKKLPAIFGWVIGSPDRTRAFLLDWRRTVHDLIEENYYRRFADLARAKKLTVQYETSFGDVLPGDPIKFWKWADEPMCEFWQPYMSPTRGGVGSNEFKPTRPCVSSAHLYGKRRVSAEALTSFELTWNEDFMLLKDVANRQFARGVTHLVTHTYTHNPRTDWKQPGSSFGNRIGTPFLRGQTWWRFMPHLTTYFARCETMLEAGWPEVDALRYLGDACGERPFETDPDPEGRQVDYLNQDALLTRIKVNRDKDLSVHPTAYSVLWIPDGTFLLPETEKKLAELKRAGATIVTGDLACLEKALDARRPRDLVVRGKSPSREDFFWLHRKDNKTDWYFVAAGTNGFSGVVDCRVGGTASVWDPATGRVVAADRDGDGVRLELAPSESRFIVFDSPEKIVEKALPTERRGGLHLCKGWTMRYPESVRKDPLKIDLHLMPWWKLRDISGEQAAFSGTVVYENTFVAPPGPLEGNGRAILDLIKVAYWAEVKVNGKDVATLWCAPYRCDITDALRPGTNVLEIAVTSTWRNRLIYDARQPEAYRKTWTIAGPDAKAPYVDYGLIGGHPWIYVTGVKTLFFAGDSTLDEHNRNPAALYGSWGTSLLKDLKPGCEIDNPASSGKSTRTFKEWGLWDKMLARVRSGDYVVMQFGHNDQKKDCHGQYAAPDGAYRDFLRGFIADVRAKGAYPYVATPIVRHYFNKDGVLFDPMVTLDADYSEAARIVAREQNVPLVDMNLLTHEYVQKLGEEKSRELFMCSQGEKTKGDHTHPCRAGGMAFARLFLDDVRARKLPIAEMFK